MEIEVRVELVFFVGFEVGCGLGFFLVFGGVC